MAAMDDYGLDDAHKQLIDSDSMYSNIYLEQHFEDSWKLNWPSTC